MPKPAVVRFAIAAFAAALLFAACGDGEPADTTPAPSAVSSPTPAHTLASPSPPPAVSEAIPLEIGPEAPFPENTALIIETGCWGCDGPPRGLDRLYHRPDGSWSIETLVDPSRLGLSPYRDSAGAERWPYIAGYAIAPELSEIAVGVCVGGSCATDGLDSWAPDSLLAVYRSADGGVTWEKLGEIAAGLSLGGAAGPGRYFVSRSEVRNVVTYEIFPDAEPVIPPAGATWAFAVIGGKPLWGTEDSRILGPDGSLFVDFGADTHPGPISSDGDRTVIAWHWTIFPSEHTDFVSVIETGSTSTFELPGLSLAMIPFAGQSLLGNVTHPSGRYAPSIVDTNAYILRPLGEPFTGPDFASGRNHIVAALRGPFARVVNTGSCLNIRDGPLLDSNVITCAADGVLLHIDSAEPPAPRWLEVTTPSGTHGYASTLYLEIPFP